MNKTVRQLSYDGVTPQIVELEFPFLPYLLAWTWTLFGWADIWGRLWSVFLSLVAVGGVYYLGRELFNVRVGLLAAAIYALMPLSIYYGRVVMPEPMAQAWKHLGFSDDLALAKFPAGERNLDSSFVNGRGNFS